MKTIKNNEVVELGLGDLRYPNQFMVDPISGLLRRKNCETESGLLFKYTISKFKKLKATDQFNYLGHCDLKVQVNDSLKIYKKVRMSSLLVYLVSTSPEKYIDVEFTSFNTTPEYTCNPLCLVKMKNGEDVLFSVSENGKKHFTVNLPGVESINCFNYLVKKRENYVRYIQTKLS